MDKYEYKIKADEIKDLIAQGNYTQAAELADSIDWRRVKSVMMLCTISDLYKINRRYEDAKDLLLLAYERRPGGRTICYSLCELSLKTEDFVQAVEYYKEFISVAPKDPGRYILQYKIFEAQNVSLEERIEVLEELKKRDYREKWAYELAYLYHRIGLATRCVEECDEMVLWFGEGRYVVKALELKQLHQPLTPEQQEIYDHRFHEGQPSRSSAEEQEDVEFSEGMYVPNGDTRIYEAVRFPEEEMSGEIFAAEDFEENGEQDSDLDIQVKIMDMGRYNTINLQEELAASLREVSEEEESSISDPFAQSLMRSMLESDTESLDMPEIDEVDEEDLEPETAHKNIIKSEVFFGETIEMSEVQAALRAETQVPDTMSGVSDKEVSQTSPAVEEKVDVTAETVMQQMQWENTRQVMAAQPPREMAEVLAQESDGQLSLVMPEKPNIEKQITGQLRIEDILTEWERLKKENEEKGREEVRKHVLAQTGDMFTEFEASIRDGLLEKLEKDEGIERDTNLNIDEEVFKLEELSKTDGIEEDAGQFDEIEESETFEEEPEESLKPEEEETFDFEEQKEQEAYETLETEETVVAEKEEPEEKEIIAENPEPEESENMEEAYDDSEPRESEEPESAAFAESLEPEEEAEIPEAQPVSESAEEPQVYQDSVEEEPVQEAVERDKVKVRSLTEEEKELFAPYIQGKQAKEQLINVLDNISMAAYTGNVIITGGEGTDTLTLAKNIVKEIKQTDSNFSGRMAKISGKALNSKDVEELITQLANGALIIQHAFDMSANTARELYQSLQQEQHGIVIILEDTKHNMEKLLERNEELLNSFTNRMDVEALSNDALVAYGKQYAKEKEFSIDAVGVLSLHTRIEELQTINHAATVIDVQNIVEEAIHHSKRKNVGHFFDVLLGKRYDDEDMIILGEKDFSQKER
ncbi:MAG: hypothetical protein NC094_05460 [Bacteroidales bacterium]|nr:hypothetical protein [Lachnoclostridium sp.]MCM1384184.1 hypothetical protein [Lachnoclostridium sp.]MCM1464850.1 hypothetical protein [Bacteroidales bacterium]